MKLIYAILIPFCIALNSCGERPVKTNLSKTTETQESEIKKPKKLLRHIVLFNFHDNTPEKKITEIENEFISLAEKIPEIYSFEWGENNSPEGLDKGLTHCFLVTFLSESDRAKYLPHPEHKKFVDFIKPFIEDVTVVDYWVR